MLLVQSNQAFRINQKRKISEVILTRTWDAFSIATLAEERTLLKGVRDLGDDHSLSGAADTWTPVSRSAVEPVHSITYLGNSLNDSKICQGSQTWGDSICVMNFMLATLLICCCVSPNTRIVRRGHSRSTFCLIALFAGSHCSTRHSEATCVSAARDIVCLLGKPVKRRLGSFNLISCRQTFPRELWWDLVWYSVKFACLIACRQTFRYES